MDTVIFGIQYHYSIVLSSDMMFIFHCLKFIYWALTISRHLPYAFHAMSYFSI